MGFPKKVNDENYFKECENRRYKFNNDINKEKTVLINIYQLI